MTSPDPLDRAALRACFAGLADVADELAAQYVAAETDLREIARTHKASRAMLDVLGADGPLCLARDTTVRALVARQLALRVAGLGAYRTATGEQARSLLGQLRALRSNMTDAPPLLEGLR